jgi:hypothetical protein
MAKRDKWRIEEAVKIAEEAGLKALRTGAEAILTEAIDETPIETGTLRRSGTVTVGGLPDGAQVYEAAEAGSEQKDAFKKETGKEKAVYISFNTPYARRQHEELDWEHPLGGKAKYLEDPFNRLKKKVVKMAELRIKKALRDAK